MLRFLWGDSLFIIPGRVGRIEIKIVDGGILIQIPSLERMGTQPYFSVLRAI